jgi:hypothetical protein
MRARAFGRFGAAAAMPFVLTGAGCVLLLLGTFLPYVDYSDAAGDDYAVFDVDHLGTTWSSGLPYLVAVGALVLAAVACRRRPRLLGAFAIGIGLVVFFDFLGAFVIGPTTFAGSVSLGAGGILGTIGGGLLLAAGAVALTRADAPAGRSSPVRPFGAAWPRRREVLAFLLAAIVVNCALGILAIALGDFNDSSDFEVKAVGSSLSITLGALVAVGCVPALRRGALRPIAAAGVIASVAGFALVFAGVWGQWSSMQFWKITSTLVVVALACAWACLLALRDLPPLHPLRVAALLSVLAFGVTSVAGVWALTTEGAFWRLFGSFGVLATSATLAALVSGGRTTVDAPADLAT